MQLRELNETDRPAWERLRRASPVDCIYADWDWQHVLQDSGWTTVPVGLEASGELRAAALVACRDLPILGWTVCDVHGSLLGRDGDSIARMLGEILRIARERRVIRVRFGIRFPPEELRRRLGCALQELLPSPADRCVGGEELGTYWIDLGSDESSWGPAAWNVHNRRNLRKALRSGLQVEEGRADSDLERFEELYRETHRRKGLPRKRRGFFGLLAPLLRRERVRLFFVREGSTTLAGAVVGAGRVYRYLWGGSSSGAKLPTGSLLHLAIMRAAEQDGAEIYDLGGAPGPDPLDAHPNYGVWRFKRGFRGRFVAFEEEYDLLLDPRRAALVHGFRLGPWRLESRDVRPSIETESS